MYKFLVIVFVGLPLVGLVLLESGAYAPSLGVFGYANGASLAYVVYVLALALSAILVISALQQPQPPAWSPMDEAAYRRFTLLLVGVEVVLLLVFLFVFGAIRVWQGEVLKGEFRVTLGGFGAPAYFVAKILVPALFAYATALYMTVPRRGWNRALWLSACGLAFLIGGCWGFKAASISTVLPALLVLYWRVSVAQFAALSGLAAGVIGFYYAYFDAAASLSEIAGRFWRRLTVMQGDVSWGIWEQYRQGVDFPPYLKTLSVVIGDRLFSKLTGITRDDYATWVEYHYDLLITHQSGVPLDHIASGHSLTGTPFAEGIVALGAWGPAVFGVLAGVLVGILYVGIDQALRLGSLKVAAVLATYFCFFGLGWLSGGAIVQLAHISVVVGFAVTYLVMKGMYDLPFSGFGRVVGQLRSNRL